MAVFTKKHVVFDAENVDYLFSRIGHPAVGAPILISPFSQSPIYISFSIKKKNSNYQHSVEDRTAIYNLQKRF
jgi:hypothetical protein